ncbi:hypothetical protein ONS95_014722 [Cadophora gregata]|uniref:uncharacterized protein n=1 Tax=Cadophora gregata TaxID=51156 RepID=UPI0026DD994C|nr:uncharacterized protein ONS95_014722 [Cadophora gregata]KAK0113012.1 hypothetical protein ONS95_014722 [Cadophora gregata]KAK0125133.1 hypothetical protein ONS96_008998 [Cadophora gregata f. sp. sojae]
MSCATKQTAEPNEINALPYGAELLAKLAAPNFLSLPVELHQEIASHLKTAAIPGTRHLRMTCRLLWNTIASESKQDLLELERSEQCIARGFIACTICLRLRHETKFVDKMRTIKRSDGTLAVLRRAKRRFCIDCGLARKLYTPGCYFQIDGVGYTMCIRDRGTEELQISAYEATEPDECRELKMLRKRYCRKCWLRIRRDVLCILDDMERETERGVMDNNTPWEQDIMGLQFSVTPRLVKRDLFLCRLREDFRKENDDSMTINFA